MMKNKRYFWNVNDMKAAFPTGENRLFGMPVHLPRVSFSRIFLMSCLFVMTMMVWEASAQSGNPAGTLSRGNTTFFAYVDDGENLDVSFTRVTGQNADATITVEGPGVAPLTCSMPAGSASPCEWTDLVGTGAGIWAITQEVTAPTTGFDWEIDVQNVAASMDGRVFTERYNMQQLGTEAPTDFSFWYQSQQGFLYQADYMGFHGVNSVFLADVTGVAELGTCVSAYESMDFIGSESDTDRLWVPAQDSPDECGGRYKIFFEEPDPALPESATRWDGVTEWIAPEPVTPGITSVSFDPDPDGEQPRSGTIEYEVDDFSGQLLVEIDTNNDGTYDLVIPGSAVDGAGSVEWDGLDGNDDPVSLFQDLPIRVSITQTGEIHFTNNDVETRAGLEVQALNGPNAGSATIYWNDADLETTGRIGTIPSPLDGTGGVNSTGGAHGWECSPISSCNQNDGETGGWGDARVINDWTFVPVDESAEIVVPAEDLDPWVCTPDGILFQGPAGEPTNVHFIDLVTAEEVDHFVIEDRNLNAAAYNIVDDYIYAWDNNLRPGTNENVGIVRVGADGATQELGLPEHDELPLDQNMPLGDIDNNGHYWVAFSTNAAPAARWFQIDLNPGPDFMEVLSWGPVGGGDADGFAGSGDWAWVPGGGDNLWRVMRDGSEWSLFRFDMDNGEHHNVGRLPTLDVQSGTFGAAYADEEFLYVSNNVSGDIYRVDIQSVTGTRFVEEGPEGGSNDGARCAIAPINTDFGDAPDNYGTLLDDDGPRHGLRDYDDVNNTTSLMLGTQVSHETDGQPDEDEADFDDFDDGVAGPIVVSPAESPSITISATNDTNEPATLVGWVDLNGDGVFGNGAERVITDVSAGSGDYTLDFPAMNTATDTYARFRLFPGAIDDADALPTGPASAGEVEDYLVEVAVEPWVCTPDGILSQGGQPTQLQFVDLVTGDVETGAIELDGRSTNAMAYNVVDDYIYAWDGTVPPGSTQAVGIVRIGADGQVLELGIPTGMNPDDTASGQPVADIDDNGHYWFGNSTGSGPTARWYRIDLNPGATFMQVLESGQMAGNPTGIPEGAFAGSGDWAWVPGGDDNLWRVMRNTNTDNWHLIRFDRSTGTNHNMGQLPALNPEGVSTFGAVFADEQFLYVSNNTSGNIYRVDVAAGTASFFTDGPPSGNNDGARCAIAPISTDYGDAPEEYGTLLDDDGPRHGLRDYDEADQTTSLMLGTQVSHETDGQPGEQADGDDVGEDGVADPIQLVEGQPTEVEVLVTNNTNEPATLAGWIDNPDGTFDNDTPVTAAVDPGFTGTLTLSFPAPSEIEDTYARFRLFPGDVTDPQPTGPASAGEVEDYLVSVAPVSVEVNLTIDECWRMLSSPVATTYDVLLDGFRTEGFPGSDDPGAAFPTVYTWPVGATGTDVGDWEPLGNLTDPVVAGQGFIFSVIDDGSGFPKTLSVSGPPHVGPVAAPLNTNGDGWSLVGNPFEVPVDFTLLDQSDLTGVAYVYDRNAGGMVGTNAGGWRTTDGTVGDIAEGKIAAFQGFFVQNGGPAPSLEFTDAAKTTGGEFYGKQQGQEPQEEGQSSHVRLELAGEGLINSAWVTFGEAGSFGRIPGDAWELTPFSEHYALLATGKGNEQLLDIAHFPLQEEVYEIPVHVETTLPGEYTLRATDIEVPAGLEAVFVDLESGTEIPLDGSFNYSFRMDQTIEGSQEMAKGDPGDPSQEGPACRDEVAGLTEQVSPQAAKAAGEEGARFVLRIGSGGAGQEIPTEVGLGQNYPNPFNPTTQIRYQLPEAAEVNLEVYDMLGRRVARLVSGTVQAGSHTVSFDASGLSSGIYMYRLQTGGAVMSRKLTVIK